MKSDVLYRLIALIACFFLLAAPTYSQDTHQVKPTHKIIYFGSSVPKGVGATNEYGYTSMFTDILKQQSAAGNTQWETLNISIGGDNTLKVLKRYEKDFLPQKGQYVIFALALGNEGIHEQGEPVFDQFERNMKILINKARTDGYTPVVTNSYTRNDYNEIDYRFIKQMNLLIHTWDVPSINLLGAIDDLAGHWTDGYWADGAHPNDAGHREMAYTIPPSLFDALEVNKPLPKRIEGSSLHFKNKGQRTKSFLFKPENIVHSFTTSINFKTAQPGTLMSFQTSGKNEGQKQGVLSIDDKGAVIYSSPKSDKISTINVNDNQWHTLTLTHYYAKGVTLLYIDTELQGTVEEQLIATDFQIGGSDIPKKIAYKDWLFYRSGMNQDEISRIAEGPLLKSSLELYAPLDGKKVEVNDPSINLAQSLNTLIEQQK